MKTLTRQSISYAYFLCITIIITLKLSAENVLDNTILSAQGDITLKVLTSAKVSPNVFYVLEVDPSQRKIKLEHAMGGGCNREPVSSIVSRTQGIAGVNGNNYRRGGMFNGNAVDLLKIKNNIYADPGIYRSALAWNADQVTPFIGPISSSIQLLVDSQCYAIDRINQPRADSEAILYTPAFGPSTRTREDGNEIIVDNNRIVKIIKNGGNSLIPTSGFVCSLGKNKKLLDLENLKEGIPVQLEYKITMHTAQGPVDITDMDYIISGAGLLVWDRRIVADFEADFKNDKAITYCADEIAANFSLEKERKWLIYDQHPRTAVGLLPDGKWLFVVVDGRQPGYSIGVTLPDLAQFMLEQGCTYALNLGGGGCSTLYFQNSIINSPCGTALYSWQNNTSTHSELTVQKEKLEHERPVCSAFVIA